MALNKLPLLASVSLFVNKNGVFVGIKMAESGEGFRSTQGKVELTVAHFSTPCCLLLSRSQSFRACQVHLILIHIRPFLDEQNEAQRGRSLTYSKWHAMEKCRPEALASYVKQTPQNA